MIQTVFKFLVKLYQNRARYAKQLSAAQAFFNQVFNKCTGGVFNTKAKWDIGKYETTHYFVVPYKMSEAGLVVHSVQCTSKKADFKYKHIFHFADVNLESRAKSFMKESARKSALDKIPLDPASMAALKSKAESEAQKSAQDIEAVFASEDTVRVVNPLLQELDHAINTSDAAHDPLIEPKFSHDQLPALEQLPWRELTEKAICEVYHEVYHNERLHKKASLGPSDIVWLGLFYKLQK